MGDQPLLCNPLLFEFIYVINIVMMSACYTDRGIGYPHDFERLSIKDVY